MHAYMTPGMLSCAVYAREDGTEIQIGAVYRERRPDPLPEGWTYLGEVVRYVRGECVYENDQYMIKR